MNITYPFVLPRQDTGPDFVAIQGLYFSQKPELHSGQRDPAARSKQDRERLHSGLISYCIEDLEVGWVKWQSRRCQGRTFA